MQKSLKLKVYQLRQQLSSILVEKVHHIETMWMTLFLFPFTTRTQ
jgi:hypothetical protein